MAGSPDLDSIDRWLWEFEPLDRVLTIYEVMRALKLSRGQVYRLVNRGKLPGFRVGFRWRFFLSDIKTLVGAEPTRRARR